MSAKPTEEHGLRAKVRAIESDLRDAREAMNDMADDNRRLREEKGRMSAQQGAVAAENIRLRDAVHELELLVAHLRGRMFERVRDDPDRVQQLEPVRQAASNEFSSAVPWTGNQQPWWHSR